MADRQAPDVVEHGPFVRLDRKSIVSVLSHLAISRGKYVEIVGINEAAESLLLISQHERQADAATIASLREEVELLTAARDRWIERFAEVTEPGSMGAMSRRDIEIERAQAAESRVSVLEGALDDALEYIDDHVDVVDGSYGEPAPNRAMSLASSIRERIETRTRSLPVNAGPAWDHPTNRIYEPVEARAKEIFDGFEYDGTSTNPRWVGGNSFKQDEARALARSELHRVGHTPLNAPHDASAVISEIAKSGDDRRGVNAGSASSDGGVEGHAAVPLEIPAQRSGVSRNPLGDGSVKVGPHCEDAAGIESGPSEVLSPDTAPPPSNTLNSRVTAAPDTITVRRRKITKHIAKRMVELRERRDLTLQNIADLSGLTKSHIWDLEAGNAKNLTIDTMFRISRAFGVSFEYLIGKSGKEPDLHPEAMRIACEIDAMLRKAGRT